MQRLGRKGRPAYRVVVQDSRWSPASGKYVALLGSYDPHTKQSTLVKDKAEFYLANGAQPSDRVVALFKSERVKLPEWVSETTKKSREIRNPEKLRKNRPAGAEPEKAQDAEAPSEEASDKPAENTEAPASEASDQEAKPDEASPAEAEKPEAQSKEPTEQEESAEKKPDSTEKEG